MTDKVIQIADYRRRKTLQDSIDKKIVIIFPTLKFILKNGKWISKEPHNP